MEISELKVIVKESLEKNMTCDQQNEFVNFCKQESIKLRGQYKSETFEQLKTEKDVSMKKMLWQEIDRYNQLNKELN